MILAKKRHKRFVEQGIVPYPVHVLSEIGFLLSQSLASASENYFMRDFNMMQNDSEFNILFITQ